MSRKAAFVALALLPLLAVASAPFSGADAQAVNATAIHDPESASYKSDCLTCHAAIRTKRHEVTYLNAAAIEQAGKDGADACHGCHGARSWYRISYPYPRTPWPDMPAEVPEWAKHRLTQSEARFLKSAVQGARP